MEVGESAMEVVGGNANTVRLPLVGYARRSLVDLMN